jgi:hypothetical protein
VDAETNAVIHITMKCSDFPPETKLVRTELTLDYKLTQLSGQKFVLPAHFQLVWAKRIAPAELKAGEFLTPHALSSAWPNPMERQSNSAQAIV